MSDPLHNLVQDTLKFLKDPLLPKETLFATAEELALFQRKAEKREAPPAPVIPSKPYTPPTLPKQEARPAPVAPPQPKAPLPPKVETPPAVERMHVEAPTSKAAVETDPIRALLQKVAPSMKLVEEVPDDAEAKKVATGWKEKIEGAEVILLACENDSETLDLLKNLAKAIDTHLGKTKILPAERLEKEKRWDLFLQKNTFRLILASDGVKKLPELMKFYRALPVQGLHFLDQTPLFMLASAATYKAIEQKAALWKTLCQMLKK